MIQIVECKGPITKVSTLRYRLLFRLVYYCAYRRKDRFVYYLKAFGLSDLVCVLALEQVYGLDNRSAKLLVGELVARPLTEPKLRDPY